MTEKKALSKKERRELRMSMGSRVSRRHATKSRQSKTRPRPRTTLAEMIEERKKP